MSAFDPRDPPPKAVSPALSSVVLSPAQIVNQGLVLYRRTLAAVAPGVLRIAVPYGLAATLLGSALEQVGELNANQPLPAEAETAAFWLAVAQFTMLACTLATTSLLMQVLRGAPARLGAALLQTAELMAPLALATLAALVLVTLGVFMFVVPGVFFFVAFCVYSYVPIVERSSPWAALYRSTELVLRAGWFHVGISLLFIAVIAIAASAVLSLLLLPLELLARAGDGLLSQFITFLIHWLSGVVLLPLLVGSMIVLYNDLLLREGRPPAANSTATDRTRSTTQPPADAGSGTDARADTDGPDGTRVSPDGREGPEGKDGTLDA
ncbi:MAG: hypothetical protein AAF918_17965 [Pseudomonadota bacterium]